MLFGSWAQDEVSAFTKTTQKAGWSVLPEGWTYLLSIMPDERKCLGIDKSAWDWTIPVWCINMYLAVKETQQMGWTKEYRTLVHSRFNQVFGSGFIIRLDNGARFRLVSPGIMKSGFYLTMSINSASQFFQHSLACKRTGLNPGVLWSLGDDNLSYVNFSFEQRNDYLDQLSKTGCIVKYAIARREFAGVKVNYTGVEPLWFDKHKFVLAHKSVGEIADYVSDLALFYQLSQARWFRNLVRKYHPGKLMMFTGRHLAASPGWVETTSR